LEKQDTHNPLKEKKEEEENKRKEGRESERKIDNCL